MVQSLIRLTASQQASNILSAWVRQDPIGLREEFEKGLSLCAQPFELGIEEEQIDLLKAIVSKLNSCPGTARPQPGDPVVRLCLTLLRHLAAKS